MELNWSLKELYESFESQEFLSDMGKLDILIKDFNNLTSYVTKNHNDEKEKLEGYIALMSEIENIFGRVSAFVSLTLSVNTKHSVALKYSDVLNNKFSELAEGDAKLKKWIGEIAHIDRIISESKALIDHEFYLKEVVEKSSYLLSDKEEVLIAKMKNTGSVAWLKLKNLLVSTLKVDIELDGEKKQLPLTEVLNLAYDKNKEKRKQGYHAEIKAYEKIEESVAAALNGIKGEVLTISDLRGYESPLEMSLINSRMDKESLDAMLTAIKESLPSFRKYLRKKAELLGYKNGLPFYELYAPVTEADMEFSYEEGTKFVEKNFRTFSNHLGDFARKAFDNSWIDVKPKEGKVGGAFCHNLHFIGESRFLLNYGSSYGDVVTMAHELGHGFHGECLRSESVLNSDYPMPLAETASIFCETIVKNAAIKDATKEQAFSMLENECGDATQVIVDIYSRFLFESELFEKRKESSLTPDEIKELMLKAQREAYGDGLDPEYLHPYMWLWKPHYYYSGANFYNFPYAFGLLFAKGLYSEYLKRGEAFVGDYEKLLALTGKNKIGDVTKVMGIDIHNVEFWRNSLKLVQEDIEKFIKLSCEK